MPFRDILLALLVVFIWGTSFIAIKLGVEAMPPIFLTAMRFLFSAVPAIFFLSRPKIPVWILIAYGFALGVAMFSLMFIAIRLGLPISLASILAQMQVFFTILLAYFVFGEAPTRLQIIGAGIAFIGIVVFGYERAQSAPMLPFMLVLASALFWGVANVIGKKAGRVDMQAFIVWASLSAPGPLLIISWLFEGQEAVMAAVTHPTWAGVLSIAYLALAATVVAFGLWSNLLSRHPVSVVTPFALLIPIVGMACGVLFFNERLTPMLLVGSAIVFAGLLINVFGDRLVRLLRSNGGTPA